MAVVPSASYSITVRLEVPADGLPASQFTCAAPDADRADDIAAALAAVEDVTVGKVSDRTFLLHLGGKIEVQSKVPLRTRDDLSMTYTPGVARLCRAIVERPEDLRRLTIKRNTVAVVTDGMAPGAIVFALANPEPEVDPMIARRHATVVATGRSDFPNQINNVLAFPGVFRGLLNAQSHSVPRHALLAAATALADVVTNEERNANDIVPSVFHPDLASTVASSVAAAVQPGAAPGGGPVSPP